MTRRAWIGTGVAVVVAAVIPEVLRQLGVGWPRWVTVLLMAFSGLTVFLGRPTLDVIANLIADRLTNTERDLPRVGDLRDEARAMLGIHPSIPLSAAESASDLDRELPSYVGRDLDLGLREWLQRSKAGGFVLIVGPAASGKSRTAYEAIRTVLPEWRLLVVRNAAELERFSQRPSRPRQTVIWLGDVHRQLAIGSSVGHAIQRLLGDSSRATTLIGTDWPEAIDRLTAEGAHDDAIEVLTMLPQRFDQPAAFSAGEWERLQETAATDPRLAEVNQLRGSGEPTQLLAASADLIRRWQYGGDQYGRAAIDAAVLARRCGMPEPLEPDLLQELAISRLSAAERAHAAKGWWTNALAWASAPVRGIIAPLTPVGTKATVVDGYAVSDILLHHDETLGTPIDDEVWQTCVAAAEGDALAAVGIAAFHGGRPELAEAALAAAAVKSSNAAYHLAQLYDGQARTEEAVQLWRKAVEGGNCCARIALASYLLAQEMPDEAEALLRVDSSHHGAADLLAKVAAGRGDAASALRHWERAAADGHPWGLLKLALAEDDPDRRAELIRRAGSGRPGCEFDGLGVLAEEEGDKEAAIGYYREAAEMGCHHAPIHLASLLFDQQPPALGEIRELLGSGDADIPFSFVLLGNLAQLDGDEVGAQRWWRAGADHGIGCAMDKLSQQAERAGDAEAAVRWLHRAIKAGCAHAIERAEAR